MEQGEKKRKKTRPLLLQLTVNEINFLAACQPAEHSIWHAYSATSYVNTVLTMDLCWQPYLSSDQEDVKLNSVGGDPIPIRINQ